MSFKQDVINKLDKIDTKQTEHTVQLAINNKILDEHHRRSTNLELRIVPIENHVLFINKSIKVLLALLAAGAALGSVMHYFFSVK